MLTKDYNLQLTFQQNICLYIQVREELLKQDKRDKSYEINWNWNILQKWDLKKATRNKKYTFFWGDKCVFSQWYMCSINIDGVLYNCAEQYMMHRKASEF